MMADPRNTILVVDGDDELRENVGECLLLERHTCWLEPDPVAALGRLRRELGVPDLILLDYRTARLSAKEFIDTLKGEGAWGRIPVVLMAAVWDRDLPGDLVIDGVLIKPFDMERLLGVVRDALSPGRAVAGARAV
jgi:CheY-like chemotaxis protein